MRRKHFRQKNLLFQISKSIYNFFVFKRHTCMTHLFQLTFIQLNKYLKKKKQQQQVKMIFRINF